MKDNALETRSIGSITPSVVIGLGGTGRKILARLKQFQLNRSLPELDIVRLLCIDTDLPDETDQAADVLFSASENLRLTVEDLPTILAHREKHPHIFNWFPGDLGVDHIRRGASQQRLLGRLSLFWNFERISAAMEQTVKHAGNLRYRTTARELGCTVMEGLNCYIIASTCGGTGSGMLLDITYMLRRLVPTAENIGLLLLPSAFHIEQQEAIEANGYATMQEIEHFLRTRRFEAHYGGSLAISVEGRAPFDRSYLFDAWTASGRHLDTADHVCDSAAEILFAKIFEGLHERHRPLVDNIQPRFREMVEGHPAAFSSVGQASLVFPRDKVLDVLAWRSLKRLAADFDGRTGDSDRDVTDFIRTHRLDEETTDDLITDLRMVDGNPLSPPIDAQGISQVPMENLVIELERIESQVREHMRAGFDTMKRLTRQKSDEISKALLELADQILADPNRGLRHLTAVLEALKSRILLFSDLLRDEVDTKFGRWRKNVFVTQKKEMITDILQGFLAFLFRKSQIQSARDECISEISKGATLDVEIQSRELGIQVYQQLLATLESITTQAKNLEERLSGCAREADLAINKRMDPRQNHPRPGEMEVLADAGRIDRIFSSTQVRPDPFPAGDGLKKLTSTEPESQRRDWFQRFRAAWQIRPETSFINGIEAENLFASRLGELRETAAPCWRPSRAELPAGFFAEEIMLVPLDAELRDEFRRHCPDAARLIFQDATDSCRVHVYRFQHGLPTHCLRGISPECRNSFARARARGRHLFVIPEADPEATIPSR